LLLYVSSMPGSVFDVVSQKSYVIAVDHSSFLFHRSLSLDIFTYSDIHVKADNSAMDSAIYNVNVI
jgi:hypothetical protein